MPKYNGIDYKIVKGIVGYIVIIGQHRMGPYNSQQDAQDAAEVEIGQMQADGKLSRMAFGDDENTSAQEPPKKEVDQGDPGPTVSKSMKETSDKVNSAGVDGLPEDAEPAIEPEIIPPEPKEKTPQEMMENPEQVLEGNEIKDALPLTGDNPEMLESMKNPQADGDVEIPKDQVAARMVFRLKIKDEDIKEAATELSGKSITEIQEETAYKWGSRACAAYEAFLETKDMEWLFDGHEYYHEAIEHAALTGDEVLSNVKAKCEPLKKKADGHNKAALTRMAQAESFDHNGVDCTVSKKQGKWVASVEGGDDFKSPPFIDKNKAIAWIKHFIDLHDDDVGMEAHLKEPGDASA